jgi:hypothetical protein
MNREPQNAEPALREWRSEREMPREPFFSREGLGTLVLSVALAIAAMGLILFGAIAVLNL